MTITQVERFEPRAPVVPVRLYREDDGLDIDTVDRRDFVNAMSSAVTGVTVVTTAGDAGQYGLTVSAVSSVSADPPMVLACINRRSPARAAVQENEVFCVNILSTSQRHVADIFAGRPGEGTAYDFSRANWNPGVSGAPQLMNAVSSCDCVLETAHDSGSHTIFIGRVVAVQHKGGKPLIYTERAYGRPCPWN